MEDLKYVISPLCLLIALTGCLRDYRRYDFATIDCSKESQVRVRTQGEKSIHSVRLHIEGKLVGKGRVKWQDTGKTEEISGDVYLNWSKEWYSTELEIEFSPIGATAGELRIYYKFEAI